MKTLIVMSFSVILAIPSITMASSTDPTVDLKTTSLGYPYTKNFSVNVKFSQSVLGLNSSQVKVTNSSIDSITGSGANYVMVIAPVNPGKIDISIPVGSVKSFANAPNQGSAILSIAALDPLVKPSSNFNLDGGI